LHAIWAIVQNLSWNRRSQENDALGIILVALVAAVTFSAEAADSSLSAAANAAYLAANARKPGVVSRPSGLQYRILHMDSANVPRRRIM